MSDEYRTLLVDAYKGELLGEALFGAYAVSDAGADHVEKLQALQRIEASTAALLRPLVAAAGIDLDADEMAQAAETGREIGAPGIEWDVFVKGLHDALPAFLANFVRVRTLAADPGDTALVALVTHEQAINAFAELELAGAGDCSLAVLQWYLETVA